MNPLDLLATEATNQIETKKRPRQTGPTKKDTEKRPRQTGTTEKDTEKIPRQTDCLVMLYKVANESPHEIVHTLSVYLDYMINIINDKMNAARQCKEPFNSL